MIIAIDGPSGSGKSTLGRMLARELNLLYIDTGSMYRAVALATIAAEIDPADTDAVAALASEADIDLEGDPDSLKVLLNGREVTEEIRTEGVTAMSSVVSTIPGVRRAMVARQRVMAQRGAVLNGRDIGTVVFPDADIKFFLTAAAEERAERRFKEDLLTNSSVSLSQTLSEMIERDRRDSSRADSPLKAAEDAIVIDSSGLSIEEVFARMMEHVHRHH
ncbi:MAG TPA: (d)CMP kinase [Pyrinomonadaceae bacterium]|nr:(d)CMP kinase [Pyrinomonadaceae bacterium]